MQEDILKRKEGENDFLYKIRLCNAKLNHEINLSWKDLRDLLGLSCSPDHLRKLSYGYKECANYISGEGTEYIQSEIKNNKIKEEAKALKEIEKDKEKIEKEIKRLESKEEKRLKVVEHEEYYIVYSGERQLKVSKEKVKEIKKAYCIDGLQVSSLCRKLNIPRRDFMLIKYAFNIVHDDVPYLDDEIENEDLDKLVDLTLEQKKNKYFLKLEEKEIANIKKEIQEYRSKDYLYNKIVDKINGISIQPNNYKIHINHSPKKRAALLDIADMHLGIVCDNYFNKYNSTIAKDRAESLTKEVIKYCAELGVSELHVSNLGDNIAGIIHESIVKESELTVDDQVDLAVKILGKMLMEFSTCGVFDKIIYSSVTGNHGRIISKKDACLEKENFEFFISWGIGLALKDRPKYSNIILETNFLDESIIYKEIEGVKIYENHGHLDKFVKMASDMAMMFNKSDEIHTAHYHHNKSEEFHSCEVFMSRSFAGTDTYAKNGRNTSKAGQRLYIYSDGQREFIHDIVF